MDKADRNYIEALIYRAEVATRTAHDVAASFGLSRAADNLDWALVFQGRAADKLRGNDRNPDGTTGPEHITSEGRELGTPKG